MNSRYLWAEQNIVQGDPEAIWGLLDDLWHFFNHRPGDRSPVSAHKSAREGESRSRSPFGRKKSGMEEYATPTLDRSRTELRPQKTVAPESRSPFLEQSLRSSRRATGRGGSYSLIHSRSPVRSPSPYRAHSRRTSITRISRREERTSEASSRQSSRGSRSAANSYRDECESTSPKRLIEFPKVGEEKERLTRLWLKSLNLTVFSVDEGEDIQRNPYRNGLLLCEVSIWLQG